MKLKVVAILALAFAGAAWPQAPPRIEHPVAEKGTVPTPVGLYPGVPLGPRKPDLSQSPVGFIDSGMDADHPQLKGLVLAARDFTQEGPQDDLRHGTKVALVFLSGIAEGKNPPGFLSAKVVGKTPVPASVTVERIVAAIQWLKSYHPFVVNISLALAGDAKDFAPLCNAMAAEEGISFIVASGNGGPQDVVYPANCAASNKMAVGAVTEEKQRAAYSGKGDVYAAGDAELVEPFEYQRLEGQRLTREGKYGQANAAYNKALAASPTPEALARIEYGLGVVADRTEKPDQALEDFRAAIKAAPAFAEAYVAAGTILTKRHDLQAASTLLESGLAAGADSPRLRDRLARVLLDLDRPQDAQKQLDALSHLDPAFDGLEDLKQAAHNRILILNRLDKGEDAQELFWTILQTGDGKLLAFLIRRGKLDVNAVPAGAQVPPIVWAANGHPNAVIALLDAGARVDACAPGNRITALMVAATTGNAALVPLLLDAGASIEATDDLGFTPLMFAAEEGKLECAQILLKRGANPFAKSREGKTAFDYATAHGNHEIAAELDRIMKASH